jgi:hypothetical protein
MNTPAKIFGSPSGEPNNHQAYASTNVRKTLDTTLRAVRSRYGKRKEGEKVSEGFKVANWGNSQGAKETSCFDRSDLLQSLSLWDEEVPPVA